MVKQVSLVEATNGIYLSARHPYRIKNDVRKNTTNFHCFRYDRVFTLLWVRYRRILLLSSLDFESCLFTIKYLGKLMTEWINCNERLPDKSGRYLVFPRYEGAIIAIAKNFEYPMNKVNIAYFKPDKSWEFSCDNSVERSNITHWAELPEAPNE